MEVEPPADRRRVHPRVERAKGCLEKVEERRGRDPVGGEAIDELGDVPPRRDQREVVAHFPIEGAGFGAGQHVQLPPTRELIGGVGERLRVPGHTTRRSADALRDDAYLAEVAREEDEDAIRLGEVVRL